MTVKVYVEGGGDHNKALQTQCRKGFSKFLEKAGLAGRMPRIVVCGRRSRAYASFCISLETASADDFPVLLVDSEAPVLDQNPWEHVRLRQGDGWARPNDASDDQIHFMVQAMEAWFHTDLDAVQRFYGQFFRMTALSQRPDIENIPKTDLFDGLRRATRLCQKGEYSKGEISFQILAEIDPTKVKRASAHADRFLRVLQRICSS